MSTPPLGWCIGCRHAAAQGANVAPLVPAAHLVNGTGLCGTCALGALGTLLAAGTITGLQAVTGRAPAPPHPGPPPGRPAP